MREGSANANHQTSETARRYFKSSPLGLPCSVGASSCDTWAARRPLLPGAPMIKAQWVKCGGDPTWGLLLRFPSGLKGMLFTSSFPTASEAMSVVREELGEVIVDPEIVRAADLYTDLLAWEA